MAIPINRKQRAMGITLILSFVAIVLAVATIRVDQALAVVADNFGTSPSQLRWASDQDKTVVLQESAKAGIKLVRCTFAWTDIWGDDIWNDPDTTKRYQPAKWNWALNDSAVAAAKANGEKILGILGFPPAWAGNNFYPPYPGYPQGHESDWVYYIQQVVGRYNNNPAYQDANGNDIVIGWEIYNEENTYLFWAPNPDSGAYINLLKLAYPVIKAIHSNDKVVMGGVAGLGRVVPALFWTWFIIPIPVPGVPSNNYQYLDYAFDYYNGIEGLDYCDAVAYHPYPFTFGSSNPSPQEPYCRYAISRIRDLIASHPKSPPGKTIELWNTEFGWDSRASGDPGFTPGNGDVGPDKQASYLLRTAINYADTSTAQYKMDKSFYYDLWDDPHEGQTDPGKGSGLLYKDGSGVWYEKKAYSYFKTFMSVLGPTTAVSKPSYIANFSLISGYEYSTPSNVLQDTEGIAIHMLDDYGNYVSGDTVRVLEEHYFQRTDGSLVVALWKTNQLTGTPDTVKLNVNQSGFLDPVRVDPLTSVRTKITTFDSRSGTAPIMNLRISIGNEPVMVELYKSPQIFWITPNSSTQTTVNITDLEGVGFKSGATVKLKKSGQSDITATNVVIVSYTKITCTFNLSGKAKGLWNVVVTNTDGTGGTLPSGFTIK